MNKLKKQFNKRSLIFKSLENIKNIPSTIVITTHNGITITIDDMFLAMTMIEAGRRSAMEEMVHAELALELKDVKY